MNKIILIIIIILLACNKRDKMITALTNDSSKYWYEYHNDTLRPTILGFCFNKNGTFISYTHSYSDKKNRLLMNNHVSAKPYWKLINDTIIMFGEEQYCKIIAFNSDSIWLQELNCNNDEEHILKLHKDKDQYTIPH